MFKKDSPLLEKTTYCLPFLIGLSLGLYFITFQIVGYSLEYFPGDFGDGRFNLYILEHAYRYLIGRIDYYWGAPFMYPEPNVISYSDNLLGTAPIYALFRILGWNIFTSFQLWFISLTVLNYAAAYLFLNKLFKNKYAAVIGAMVFAFSIALQSQLTHAQTFPRFPIPLAFLMAFQFRTNLKPRYFFLCIFLVVYQMYCAIYLGLMLSVPLGIFFITIVISQRKKIKIQKGKWYLSLLGSLVLNALFLLPLMIPYVERSSSPSIHYFREIFHTIPSLKSHFFSQKGSIIWDFLSNVASEYPASWDHQIFAGGIATISIIVFGFSMLYRGFFAKENSIGNNNGTFQFFKTALISKILFLRIGIISAYILIFFLPGFSAMRSITRIINIELLFFAFATAFVLTFLLNKNQWKNISIFLLFVGLFLLDNYMHEDFIYHKEKKEAVEKSAGLIDLMGTFPEKSIVSYEPQSKDFPTIEYQLDAMLASQATNNIVINAYTATSPPTYTDFWNTMDASSRIKWLESNDFYRDSLFVIQSPNQYYLLTEKDKDRSITGVIDPDKYTLINQENPYSPTFKFISYDLPIDKKSYSISIKGLTAAINSSVHAVVSLDKDGEKLYYKGFPLIQNSGDWYKYTFEAELPNEVPEGSVLSFYVWNPSQQDFFIDQMKIHIE